MSRKGMESQHIKMRGQTKKQEDILEQLESDPTKVKMLKDILTLKSGKDDDEANNKNVVKWIKTAMKGKYGDHVRKALKLRDFTALQCVLALESNWEATTQDKMDPTSTTIKTQRTLENKEEQVVVKPAAANVLCTMMYEFHRDQLRLSYRKLLTTAMPILELSDYFVNQQPDFPIDFHNLTIKPKFTHYKNSFGRNAKALIVLTGDQSLVPFEGSSELASLMKRYWIQEMFYLMAVNYMVGEFKDLEEKQDERRAELNSELKFLQDAIEEAKKDRFQLVREEVKQAEILKVLNDKIEFGRQSQNAADTASTMNIRIDILLKQNKREEEMRFKKLTLENELEAVIAKYDEELINGQTLLDNIDAEIKENETTLENLKKKFADIEEKFDDMTRTLKLRELLKSIEMADSFKRNRAARIIQSVWRRYKLMKYKKMKKKLKLRRKTVKKDGGGGDKTKDSSSEAGKGSTRSGSVAPVSVTKSRAPSTTGSEPPQPFNKIKPNTKKVEKVKSK